MRSFIIKRILSLIPLLIGISLVSFFIVHLAPGKPTDVGMGIQPLQSKMSQEAREKLIKLYELDKPLVQQYFIWLKKLVIFDFGKSFVDGRPVVEKILERLPITVAINLLALLIVYLIAIPLGVISALRKDSFSDRILTFLIFIGFSVPSFWLALVMIHKFSVQLGWFPVSGIVSLDFEFYSFPKKILDIVHHLILPLCVIVVGSIAGLSRYMRQGMLNVLSEDYIRTANAFGLPKNKVIYNYALRNALLPIITLLGLSLPGIISGSLIFETIFNIPGLGRLMYEAAFSRDYNIIMAVLVMSAFLTLLGNFFADIVYAYVDPRIKYQGKR